MPSQEGAFESYKTSTSINFARRGRGFPVEKKSKSSETEVSYVLLGICGVYLHRPCDAPFRPPPKYWMGDILMTSRS